MATKDAPHLRLEIATPTGLRLAVDAESVQAPSVGGEVGVLPDHLPLLAATRAGVLRFRAEGKDRVVAIGPGFVEVGPSKVLVLTDAYAEPGDIDPKAAKDELEAAEKKLGAYADAFEGAEFELLQRAVDWAQAQLDATAN